MNSFDNFRQTSSPDISVTVKTETAKKISLFKSIAAWYNHFFDKI